MPQNQQIGLDRIYYLRKQLCQQGALQWNITIVHPVVPLNFKDIINGST